jgi:iron complex transport system permease protein
VFAFLLGSVAGRTWSDFWLVLPWLGLGIPLALVCGRLLNLLQLGDELAEGLGLKTGRTRIFLCLLACAIVAAVVTTCGPISFVGLLAPHLARRLLGTTNAWQVLPVTALFGAGLLVVSDLLARQMSFPIELPIGSFTTLVGGLLLVWLLGRPVNSPNAKQNRKEKRENSSGGA